MYNNIIGSKYESVKDLDIKEIAKLIRQDLKKFKDCKFKVNIQRFANGQSLWIKVIKCDLMKILNDRLNPIFEKEIEDIINQYNFDKSHPQSDYFHVNFYSHIMLDLKEGKA